jgi:hypothetical protein
MKQSLKILAICIKIFFLFAPLATGQSAINGKKTNPDNRLPGMQLNLNKITVENTNIFHATMITDRIDKLSRSVVKSYCRKSCFPAQR